MTEISYAVAIKDVLECRIKPKREMKFGRTLTPILSAHPHTHEQQRDFLIVALLDIIDQHIQAIRLTQVGADQAAEYATWTAKQRLERDMRSDIPELQALSIVWAYYAEGIGKKNIGAVYGLSVRAIEYRLTDAYEYMARRILSSQAASAHSADGPSPSQQPTPQAGGITINGNQHAQTLVNGPVGTITTTTTTKYVTTSKSSDDVQLETMVPLMISGGVLMVLMRWSVIATLVLLGLIVWRALANGRLAYDNWNSTTAGPKDQENVWYLMYALPWAALCLFGLYIATMLPSALKYDTYEVPRIILAFHLFFLGAGVLVLGFVDVIFFFHHTDDNGFIARWLPRWKQNAANIWEKRRMTMFWCWAFLVLCFGAGLLITNMWMRGFSVTP